MGTEMVRIELPDGFEMLPASFGGARIKVELERLRARLNTPELHDFSAGVVSEAQHQRERWGVEGDAGKTPADWFWLVGYLAGKALTAANGGNQDKALHHCVSTAAAIANWHAAMSGQHSGMRPGIETPSGEAEGVDAAEEQGLASSPANTNPPIEGDGK